MGGRKLQTCEVVTDRFSTLGSLYMKNKRFLVLLNNIRGTADLGPLRRIRREHTEPEADVLVLPRGMVKTINIFQTDS